VAAPAEGRMDIAQKVKEIVAQQLDVDGSEVKEEAQFIEDLGADSLAIVELVLAFEEQFEIDIPDEDTEKIATVGDAIKYITEHVK
jgi:acyl carrier protein